MNAFSAGIDVLFGDPNLTAEAVYRAGGAGAGVAVRVMLSRPDRIDSWSEVRVVSGSLEIGVRVSDAPYLAEGDTFEFGAVLHRVRGEPVKDAEQAVWTAEAVAL